MSQRALPVVASRVGLIGDVHTERARLAAALEFFAKVGVDRVLCTGDVPDGPGDPREVDACCALLARASVLTISGNHDRWLLDGEMRDLPDATPSEDVSAATLAFLRALPQTAQIETPAGLALLCHGLGTDDMAQVAPFDHGRALEDNVPLQELLARKRHRFVLNGHSHKAMVRVIEDVTLINGGTLLGDHSPCCTIVDFGARRLYVHAVHADGSIGDAVETAL